MCTLVKSKKKIDLEAKPVTSSRDGLRRRLTGIMIRGLAWCNQDHLAAKLTAYCQSYGLFVFAVRQHHWHG